MLLNLGSTILEQDNKCLECGKKLNPDRVYFRMDQTKHQYEVYCEVCGIEKDKEDRRNGL